MISFKDDKLEHHNTTGKMVKKESIENVNNEKNETVPLRMYARSLNETNEYVTAKIFCSTKNVSSKV
jgi:hypothetical protein